MIGKAMANYRKEIILTTKEDNYYNKILNSKELMGEDDTISLKADFGNGFEMDVKICGTKKDYPWTEAVLFFNGSEVCCTEPETEIMGEWTLECSGNIFTTVISLEND